MSRPFPEDVHILWKWADDTGKTLKAIGVVSKLFLLNKVRRLLIVAPLSIVGVWKSEFEKFCSIDYVLAVLDGTLAKKKDTLRHLSSESALTVAVVNYESAWRMETEIIAWLNGAGAGKTTVICDEAHKIKGHKNNASKAMWRIGAIAGYRLLLTGTLVTNHAEDVFSQYRFLNPAIFGMSFYSWRNRYFDAYGYGLHQFKLKKSMEPEFTEKVHSIAYRATKAECLSLPPLTDVIRAVDLEPAAMKLYRSLVNDSYAELGGGSVTATNILTRLLRLSQLTGGFLGGDDDQRPQSVSKAKLDALDDIIEAAQAENHKVVIIARFIAEMDAIKKLLESKHIEFTAISGETKDRAEQVRRFQEDENVTAFVGQIATAGLGITLTAASTLAFYSLSYSSSDFEQAKARIHRSGQTEPCTYYYIIVRNTVDERILKALHDKADLARTLIDDYRRGLNPFQ